MFLPFCVNFQLNDPLDATFPKHVVRRSISAPAQLELSFKPTWNEKAGNYSQVTDEEFQLQERKWTSRGHASSQGVGTGHSATVMFTKCHWTACSVFYYWKLEWVAKRWLSHFEIPTSSFSFILGVTCPSRIRIQTSHDRTVCARKWGRSRKCPYRGPVTLNTLFPSWEAGSSDRAIPVFSSIILTFSKNYGKMLATEDRKKVSYGVSDWGSQVPLFPGRVSHQRKQGKGCVCVEEAWWWCWAPTPISNLWEVGVKESYRITTYKTQKVGLERRESILITGTPRMSHALGLRTDIGGIMRILWKAAWWITISWSLSFQTWKIKIRIKIFLVRWLRGLIKMIYVKDMVQRQVVGRLLFSSSCVPRRGESVEMK